MHMDEQYERCMDTSGELDASTPVTLLPFICKALS